MRLWNVEFSLSFLDLLDRLSFQAAQGQLPTKLHRRGWDPRIGVAKPLKSGHYRRVNIWQKLSRVMGVLIFVAAILAVAVWYIPLFEQNERMRKEIQSLHTQIRREDQVSRHLEASIKALKDDPKTVERMAREKLGYAKPGETVIFFEEKPNSPVILPSR